MKKFDEAVNKLANIKLNSSSKAEFEFFKAFLRGHYAEDLSQGNDNSDFVMIGKAFHRWVHDHGALLNLKDSQSYIDFIDRIDYFSKQYLHIYECINSGNTDDFFYLIVNNDYGFTLQPALILSAIAFNDSDEVVKEKIQVVSKYLTKVLSWRVWNQMIISQSSMESTIYALCKKIREKSLNEIKAILDTNPIELPGLNTVPNLNQQNKKKIRVLLALITEIVARESNETDYLLKKTDIEIEHIWSNHFDEHVDEFTDQGEFNTVRNNIGDLLLLPKSFNASYNDETYSVKVEQYFSQNILAQTLNEKKYANDPGFLKFKDLSGLLFKPYKEFKRASIAERAELYKQILIWNWPK